MHQWDSMYSYKWGDVGRFWTKAKVKNDASTPGWCKLSYLTSMLFVSITVFTSSYCRIIFARVFFNYTLVTCTEDLGSNGSTTCLAASCCQFRQGVCAISNRCHTVPSSDPVFFWNNQGQVSDQLDSKDSRLDYSIQFQVIWCTESWKNAQTWHLQLAHCLDFLCISCGVFPPSIPPV